MLMNFVSVTLGSGNKKKERKNVNPEGFTIKLPDDFDATIYDLKVDGADGSDGSGSDSDTDGDDAEPGYGLGDYDISARRR